MQRQSAQRHRVNRVVNFAYENLAESLDLDQLAEVACLSKYHFLRVFSRYQRESPVQFLWRLRLERAARSLVIRQESSITDIALDCGFSCSQTFSRAFRRQFGIAPRALRSKECRTF
ncbi:MAG: helix-turn-helix domain-containing protein, partial [Pseudomonadota bacterium]